jgi:protoheme IX farnesyltransferase
VLITLLGGTLAAGGANAINMVVDRDIDALMPRTAGSAAGHRAHHSPAALVFAIGLELLAFGVLWAWANLLSAVPHDRATLFYVFVYTLWLKRTSPRTSSSVAPPAPCRCSSAGRPCRTTSPGRPVVLFVLMFLWTPPHFWALAIRYVDDYRAANVPMLPAVATMEVTVDQDGALHGG